MALFLRFDKLPFKIEYKNCGDFQTTLYMPMPSGRFCKFTRNTTGKFYNVTTVATMIPVKKAALPLFFFKL